MYRDDVAALAARHAALEAEVATKRRELDTTTQLLDEARGARKLPVLADIRVASPCKASWGDMQGDERVRHCGECQKNVYNLSAMTRDEAEALIFAHEGRLCVRYFRRTDGTILFGDCWVGAQRRRRVKVAAIATAAALGAGALATQLGAELKRVFRAESAVDLGSEAALGEYAQGGLADLPISQPPQAMLGELRAPDVPPELAREAAVEEAQRVLRGEWTPGLAGDRVLDGLSVPPSPSAGELNGGFGPRSAAREHER